jgi:hypothetical protein
VIDLSRQPLLEKNPAKRIDAMRRRNAAIPTTAPSAYRCSEILARAQPRETLADADRDALKKECPS